MGSVVIRERKKKEILSWLKKKDLMSWRFVTQARASSYDEPHHICERVCFIKPRLEESQRRRLSNGLKQF